MCLKGTMEIEKGEEVSMSTEHNEHEQDREFGREKPKRNFKKLLLLLLLSAIVLIGAAITGMHFTSQPSFCGTCHEMKSQVTAWSNGPHKDVPCLECHSTPGTVGYVKVKLSGLHQVYTHLTNQVPSQIVANVDPKACIACHTGNSEYPKAKNIKLTSGALAPKISHAQVLKDNTSCLVCHKSVGHGQPQNVTTPSTTTPTTTASGKDVYDTNCSSCHGAGGAGASAPILNNGKTQAKVLDITKRGKGSMPGFAGQLSDAEIQAVSQYVADLKK